MTAALGPVLGGWLIDHLSWRAAFFINAPLAVVAIAIALRYVPESRNETQQQGLDWPGALLVTLGFGGVTYGLIESSNAGWTDPGILASLALGILALAGFVAVEMHRTAPLLPLRLFRSIPFVGANVLTFFLYAALGGSLFFVPLDLIQVQGYSTAGAGAALLPFILVLSLLSRWSGGLIERYGAKPPLVMGPVLAGAGFALLAVPGVGGSYWVTFFPAMLVLGTGMAISVAPLTTTVMNSVETAFAGAASGINNAVSRIAALLAVALFGLVMAALFDRSLHSELSRAQLSPQVIETVERQKNRLAAIDLPPSLNARDAPVARKAVQQAFVTGFRWVMLISAALSLASAAVAWLTIGQTPPKDAAVPRF